MESKQLDSVLRYPKEWKLLPLHGVLENGCCNCYKGVNCTAPGKHPIDKNWKDSASNDEEQLIEWFDIERPRNVGLLLGKDSGVVDIEFDDDRGRQLAEELMAGMQTPTYTSGRSVHRLFKWSDELPDIQKRVINGLECRLGGGGKSTQSVLPPSSHHSGVKYEWLPGLSPEEVELMEVPRSIIALLTNREELDVETKARSENAQKVYDQGTIEVGEQESTMLAFACRQAKMLDNINDPEDQAFLWDSMSGINVRKYRPPIEDVDLRRLHSQAIKYTQRDETSVVVAEAAYTLHGLEFKDDQWLPGMWQLYIVTSDPPEYRLHVPAWVEMSEGGNITMSAETFVDANKMAMAVFTSTSEVWLCDQPRKWPSIWNGLAKTKTGGGRIGLCKRLLDARQSVDPPAVHKRSVVVAEWLAERVAMAEDLRDGEKAPDDSATPTKMSDGSVWIRWEKLWQDGILSKEIQPLEPRRLFDALQLTKKQQKIAKDAHGQRRRFTILEPVHLERLLDIAGTE